MQAVQKRADTIYHNGTIITMTGEEDRVEAVAVSGETIIAAGTLEDVKKTAGDKTVFEDLEGNAMLPGFYDGHSHFSTGGLTALYYVDLRSKPIGSMTCIADYVEALKERAESVSAGKPVLGTGYDQTTIKEMRHPTRWELDRVSMEHPVLLNHVTAHSMTVNSKALEIMGIDENTPDPDGGVIHRDENGVPTGVLEEAAVFSVWYNEEFNIFGSTEEQMEAFAYNSNLYASVGVTTANEGSIANLGQYEMALEHKKLAIRATLWFAPEVLLKEKPVSHSSMLTIGGGKAFQDGSINCYTAYLTKPYYKLEKDMEPSYCGYPSMSSEKLNEIVRDVTDAGYNMFIHCNGDAAIDDVLNAYENVRKRHPAGNQRLVAIHAQTARMDQLEKMKQYDIIPSFYVSNIYYTGDRFNDIFLGPERTAFADPIGTAMRMGLPATMHLDTPVQPQDPLLSMWASVNRVTAGGRVLGENERITPYQALLANTYYPAYQNGEEATKGTIETGKLADFVILDQNPLEIDPMKIKDIAVLRTIVGNKEVYCRGN